MLSEQYNLRPCGCVTKKMVGNPVVTRCKACKKKDKALRARTHMETVVGGFDLAQALNRVFSNREMDQINEAINRRRRSR